MLVTPLSYENIMDLHESDEFKVSRYETKLSFIALKFITILIS